MPPLVKRAVRVYGKEGKKVGRANKPPKAQTTRSVASARHGRKAELDTMMSHCAMSTSGEPGARTTQRPRCSHHAGADSQDGEIHVEDPAQAIIAHDLYARNKIYRRLETPTMQ